MSCNACLSENTTGSCAACGTVKYCSKTCQTKDWPTHKHLCAKIPICMRSVKWRLGLDTDKLKFLYEDCYPETAKIGLEAFIKRNFESEERVDSVLFFRLWKHALTEEYGKSTLIMNIKEAVIVEAERNEDFMFLSSTNGHIAIHSKPPVISNFFKLTLKNNYLKKKLEEIGIIYGMILMRVNGGYVFLSVLGPMVAQLEDIIRLEASHIDARLKYKGIDVVSSIIDDLKLDHKWRLKPLNY